MSNIPVIKLQNLCKNFVTPAGTTTVLNNINLTVNAGESVALCGVSGSGKSTLLNLIGSLDKASCGIVEVCSHDLNQLTIKQQTDFRAKNIGFIFQFFNLIPILTVLENIKSALEPLELKLDEIESRAIKSLADVGLVAYDNKFPNQLSGGEQQRVSIARAIVKCPTLILADEPTGNLDVENAKKILALLKNLQHEIKATLIIATHDPMILSYVDRIITIKNNILMEDK